MEKYDVYKEISKRTGGDIYIGVVGPVRTGKSTFISKFVEKLVLPNIGNKLQKQIATDEMPQSADGKTIMTTQPKFVPANAVKVQFPLLLPGGVLSIWPAIPASFRQFFSNRLNQPELRLHCKALLFR